jgi:hypothetical protein
MAVHMVAINFTIPTTKPTNDTAVADIAQPTSLAGRVKQTITHTKLTISPDSMTTTNNNNLTLGEAGRTRSFWGPRIRAWVQAWVLAWRLKRKTKKSMQFEFDA